MGKCKFPYSMTITFCALLVTACFSSPAFSKEKTPVVGPDDLTFRLYQLLDKSYGGKVAEFYVIGDIYKNPKVEGQELQHVFRMEYDKDRAFGRLRLYVRSVDKLTAEQLKNYTAKQVYEFGEIDVEKFTKTDPGSLGRVGDLYFQASENGPLATVPITEDARKEYETYVSQWLLPALEKK